MFEANSKTDIQRRKCQEALNLCGTGIIVFALWSIMKLILQVITKNDAIFAAFTSSSKEVKILTVIVIVMIIIIDAFLRIYIWRSIKKETNHISHTNKHLVITGIILVLNLAMVILGFVSIVLVQVSLSSIMELVIDLADDIILIEVFIQTFKLRKLNVSAVREV